MKKIISKVRKSIIPSKSLESSKMQIKEHGYQKMQM